MQLTLPKVKSATDGYGKPVGYRKKAAILNVEAQSCFGIFWSGDPHIDSTECMRKLLEKHLQQAVARNMGIIMPGDIFDVMQGKGDRRASVGGLKPEYLDAAMWRAIVDDVAKFLAPYASHILCLGTGNHETAVLSYHHVDLLHELQERITALTGITIPIMEYDFWVSIGVKIGDKHMATIKGYVHHGFGGNSPVTKGIIQFARKAEEVDDVDFMVMAHTHTSTVHPIKRRSVAGTPQGMMVQERTTWAIRPPSYQGTNAWAKEKGFAAPSFGGVAMTYKMERPYNGKNPRTTKIVGQPELWIE